MQTIAKSQEKIDLGSTLKIQIEALMIARNNVDQELIRAKIDGWSKAMAEPEER